MPALEKTKFARLAGVVSGHEEKGTAVANKFKLDPKHFYNYETFDRIADDPDIDVVYIVLPNSMHAEFTIRAAKAGKHVFCEKPMAMSVAECQQMIDACKAAGKQLAIAYRMQYEPHLIEARRLCRDGAIGKITHITSVNGFNIGGGGWRLNKKLSGGGALVDIGIYSLNAARFVMGEEPVEVSATIQAAPNDPRFKEVEGDMDFSLKFRGGIVADCKTSYSANIGSHLHIEGEKGSIDMLPAFFYWANVLSITREGKREVVNLPAGDQFAAEMDDFCQCILENKPSRTPGEEGLKDMQVIEALYRSAAENKPIAIDPAGTTSPSPTAR
jgi:predicted dehydrogenase